VRYGSGVADDAGAASTSISWERRRSYERFPGRICFRWLSDRALDGIFFGFVKIPMKGIAWRFVIRSVLLLNVIRTALGTMLTEDLHLLRGYAKASV
jgi:hypothetical protein